MWGTDDIRGSSTRRLGDPFGGALVVGCKRHADVAVVKDGMVLPIRLVDLGERLRNQKTADAIRK